MLYSRLANKLTEKFPGTEAVILDDSLLLRLQYLGADEAFLPDTLYVTFGERAIVRTVFPHDLIVFFKDEQERSALTDHFSKNAEPSNLLYIPWQYYESTMNEVQDFMQKGQRNGDSYSKFLRMVVDGKDPYYLLAEAAKQCGRQLVALDISGKLLGYSPVQSYLTEDWLDAIKNGYCPVDVMEHLHEKLLTRSQISSTPFVYFCDQTKLTYLSSPVIISGSPYGYVFLLSDTEKFDPVAYDILPILSKVMGDYLRRSRQGESSRNHLFHELVRDILHGEAPDSVRSRLASGKLPIPKQMRVIVIHFYYAEKEVEALKLLSSQLTLLFGPYTPLRLGNELILLQDMSPGREKQNRKAMEFLDQFADSNHLFVGVSNEFTKIDRFAEHYAEAGEALKLAARMHIDDNVIYYQDVAFYSLLCKIPSSEKMRTFCHPALKILQRYDAEFNTDLLETLRIYIDTNCNQKLTSELMFTHRNTISYRRKQIEDLTGIDFADAETLFQLGYSLKIYQFLDT